MIQKRYLSRVQHDLIALIFNFSTLYRLMMSEKEKFHHVDFDGIVRFGSVFVLINFDFNNIFPL